MENDDASVEDEDKSSKKLTMDDEETIKKQAEALRQKLCDLSLGDFDKMLHEISKENETPLLLRNGASTQLAKKFGLNIQEPSTSTSKEQVENGVVKVDPSSPKSTPNPKQESQNVWSWTTSFKQRQHNMLRFGFFSDFTVILGHQKQKVLVHKAVLASSSIILYHAVLKVLSEGINELELVEEDPIIFTLFLQYCYTGDSGAQFKDAFSLQKLAQKYQVPDLDKQCEFIISSQEFNLDSAYILLPLASNSSHETLLAALIDFACKNGSIFIKDPRFTTLPEAVVIEILKRDDLVVKHDMEVLSAVVHWAQHQCKLNNLDEINPANFGPIVSKYLRYIRFPCDFSNKFWIPYLEKIGIKNPNQILRDLFTPRHHFNPYNKTLRKYSEPMCLVHARYSGDQPTIPLVPWKCKNTKIRLKETLMFQVNFPFTFFGFSIVQGVFGEDFENNVYDYSELIIQTTMITNSSINPVADVEFEVESSKPDLQVKFSEPIDIPAHKWVTLVISLGGNLLVKSKNGSSFQKVLISNCQLFVGSGMTSDHNTTFITLDVKMILPIMCEFKRSSSGGDQLPIDKGYISSLLFSLNRPHPQGKGPSKQPTNITPLHCSFE